MISQSFWTLLAAGMRINCTNWSLGSCEVVDKVFPEEAMSYLKNRISGLRDADSMRNRLTGGSVHMFLV